jgi:hypothetical protein
MPLASVLAGRGALARAVTRGQSSQRRGSSSTARCWARADFAALLANLALSEVRRKFSGLMAGTIGATARRARLTRRGHQFKRNCNQ